MPEIPCFFKMHSNLSCCQLKRDYYIHRCYTICELHGNHKKKLTVSTQKKMRKESKRNTKESHHGGGVGTGDNCT